MDHRSGDTFQLKTGDSFQVFLTEHAGGTFRRTAFDPSVVYFTANLRVDVNLVPSLPDLVATPLSWSAGDGGVDYGERLNDARIASESSVALYWAADASAGSIIGGPIPGTSHPVAWGRGQTETYHATPAMLGTPPPGAKYLVAIVDPDHTLTEVDESNNTASLAVPDLKMTALSWHPDTLDTWNANPLTAGGVGLSYEVANADLPADTTVAFYWASGPDFNDIIQPESGPAFSAPAEKVQGKHTLRVSSGQLGLPPRGTMDLLAVLDPTDAQHPTGRIYELDESSNDNQRPLDASPASVIGDSVYVPDPTGTPEIAAAFQPENGALDLAQAAAICGVDHFNWTQTFDIPYPLGATLYQVNIPRAYYTELTDANGVLYAVPDVLFVRALGAFYEFVDSDHDGKYQRGDSFLSVPDGDVTQVANLGVADPLEQRFLRATPEPLYSFLIIVSNNGDSLQVKLPDSDPKAPGWQPPDDKPFYYNEGNDLQSNSTAYDLTFYDKPGLATATGQVDFTTRLAGVSVTGDDVRLSGAKSMIRWSTNAIGVDDFVQLASSNPAGTPPPSPGGIFNVQLLDQPANHPPTLAPIADQYVAEGRTLTVHAVATDPDAEEVLTYSLDPGAPAGARIDPTTGVFTWSSTVPAAGTVTVRVSDAGTPRYTASQTFRVSAFDVPPQPQVSPNSVKFHGTSFTAAGWFTDPGADTWTATVSYGDGSAPRALALNPNKTFALAHTYAASGHYTVTVIVTAAGGPRGVLQIGLTVVGQHPIPPPLTIKSVRFVTSGGPPSLIIGFSEPMTPQGVLAPSNYVIQLPASGRGGHPQIVRVSGASYDPQSDVVKLLLGGLMPVGQKVQVKVIGAAPGGPTNIWGRLLDGDRNGTPGGTASFSVVLVRLPKPPTTKK